MDAIISPQRTDISSLTSSHKLIGKTVLSVEGKEVGELTGLYLDGDSLKGIEVTYEKKKYFIDLQYVKNVHAEAVMLTTQPYYALLGMKVYDDSGNYVGEVDKVTRKRSSNKYETLFVKPNFFSSMIELDADTIKTARGNVILNETIDDNNR